MSGNIGARKLFVGCLPFSKGAEDIEALFAQCGEVETVKVFTQPNGLNKI